MKKRTFAGIAAGTIGLLFLGAGAAGAVTGTAPVDWAQQTARYAGFGFGPGDGTGTGDPETCPFYDGSGDLVQNRMRDMVQNQTRDLVQNQIQSRDLIQKQTRDRLQDPTLNNGASPQQLRQQDRIHVPN